MPMRFCTSPMEKGMLSALATIHNLETPRTPTIRDFDQSDQSRNDRAFSASFCRRQDVQFKIQPAWNPKVNILPPSGGGSFFRPRFFPQRDIGLQLLHHP